MESVSAATAINISTNGSDVSETASKEQQDLSHDNHQQQQHQQQSASKTVCYLANGSTVDRLNLVLPLTAAASTTQPPLIFLPTSQLPQLNNSNNSTNDYYSSDVDRTPVNTATDRKERIFSFSSCRTVDSGTESLCSGDGPMHFSDAHSAASDSVTADLAADRILKFFAAEDSKSNRVFAAATGGHQRIRRRPTAANIRQTSTDPDDDDGEDDGEEDEDVYSDSSTLSESSVNSPSAEFAPTAAVASSLITPESVVAAIDAKIRQREALAAVQTNRSTMATADKTACDDAAVKETVILGTAQVANKSSADFLFKAEEEQEDYLDNEDAEEDEDDCPPVRLIRSTSLKTGKTPPGTPCGKKIVRFADALGLDLESVRHIVDDGKPYMPPLAAFKGLTLDDEDKRWLFGSGGGGGAGGVGIGGSSSGGACSATAAEFGAPSAIGSASSSSHLLTTPHLRLLFVQPSSDPGPFLERVRSQRVCLENCLVSGPSGPTDLFTVTAIVRVLNVGFEKSLLLRYTTNEWLTWTDVVAGYVAGSCDGFSDKFSAAFHVAVNSNGHQSMMPGQRLLFALRYAANGGQEFWDNNLGMNYALIYQRS